MKAVIYPRSGVALLVEPEGVSTLHRDAPGRVVPRTPAELRHLLPPSPDAEVLEDAALDDVRARLLRACREREALDLALMALDPELSEAVRRRAVGLLASFPETGEVVDHLSRVLYAAPLPTPDGLAGAAGLASSASPALAGFFRDLADSQPAIAEVRAAWERARPRAFASDAAARRFERRAVRAGLFRELAHLARRGKLPEASRSPETAALEAEPETAEVQLLWLAEVLTAVTASRRDAAVGDAEAAAAATRSTGRGVLANPLSLQALPSRPEGVVGAEGERSRARSYGIVGNSAAMRGVVAMVERIAPTGLDVLLTGESGTGKEWIARAIHAASGRALGPFLTVHCGAFSDESLDGALFGHEQGASPGAAARRRGLVEEAGGGTLYLDEIGEMSPRLQAKLLHTIQGQQIPRAGGGDEVPTDVRWIVGSNRDLEPEVREGRFRADLFHRLSGFSIRVPPLRERREDVPLLARHFLREVGSRIGRPDLHLASDAVQALSAHDWPGNVRELRLAVERAAALTHSDVITAAYFSSVPYPGRRVVGGILAEREYLLRVLAQAKGDVSRAAELAGISQAALDRMLRKYDVGGGGREH